MPVYSPFDPAVTNAFQPGEYARYEPFAGFPLAGYLDAAMQMGGLGNGSGLNIGINNNSNLYNNLHQQMRTKRHSVAIQAAAMADANLSVNLARGAYNVAGRGDQFTGQTESDVRNWHNSIIPQVAPFFDNPQAVRAYDMMLGGRSLLPLTHYIHSAGSSQRDPQLGVLGVSPNSANAVAKSIQDRFFGDNSSFQASGGLRSAEMGELYRSLATSGRLPDLSKGSDPKLDRWGQSGAADRVNDVLGRYARVLGTMKEIFAAEGRPDLPINQLLDAADKLTGGLQQVSSREAESKIRGVYNSAQRLGLGMDAVVASMRVSSSQASAYGINDVFALPLAQQGLDFRSAANQIGALSTPVWGAQSLDQMQARVSQHGAGFIASEAGNRVGMLHRLAARHFGNNQGGIDASAIQGDTPMARAMRALASGDYSNQDLAGLLSGNESSFLNQVSGQFGISTGSAAMEMQFSQQNQEAVYRNNLGRFGAAAQREELSSLLFGSGDNTSFFGTPTYAMVGEMLGNSTEAQGLAGGLSAVSRDALLGASVADQSDPAKRKAVMVAAMRKQLEAQANGSGPQADAARKMLANLNNSSLGLEGSLGALAESQYAAAENYGMQAGLIDTNLINYLRELNPETQAAMDAAAAQSTVQGSQQSATLGLTDPTGVLSRALGALHKAGSGQGGQSVTDVLKSSLGASDDQAGKMAEILSNLDQEMLALEHEKANLKPGETSDRYEALQKTIKEEQAAWQSYLDYPANKNLRETLAGGADGSGAGGSGSPSSWNMQNVTLYVNGQPLVQSGSGSGAVAQGTRGGGPTP